MSHYTTVATLFRDPACLAEALRQEFGTVEVYAEAQHLYGYQGDRREQVAHIIVRRQFVGVASNDLGFVRGADGVFQAIISEYDGRQGRNKAWLAALTQRYAVAVLRAQAAKLGYRVAGQMKDEQGNVRLVLEV